MRKPFQGCPKSAELVRQMRANILARTHNIGGAYLDALINLHRQDAAWQALKDVQDSERQDRAIAEALQTKEEEK